MDKVLRRDRSQDRHEGDAGGRGPTLAEAAYRRMRDDIIAGAFEPGRPLRLEVLRTRYGFSFSPLREALNRLQSERLVTLAALKGFSVAPLSITEMWDVVETRILIECEALRRSIAAGDDAWEAEIVAAFHALSLKTGRLGEPDREASAAIEAIEDSHRDFHHSLIRQCGSPRLLGLAGTLYVETERYRRPALLGSGREGPCRDVVAEHREIMDAALARKAGLAAKRLAEHYRHTARHVELKLETPA